MTNPKSADVVGGLFDYRAGDTILESYVAHDTSVGPRPCILLAHAWDGQNERMHRIADEYAAQGYLAFALDIYGKGVRGDVHADNSHLMNPYMADRGLLRDRMTAALDEMRRHPLADTSRVAAIGYCFGGLCVLDLARSGAKGLHGAISIHALLTPPNLGAQPPITARILMLHGWEDPVAPQQDVLQVAREMTDAGADWQLNAFGHAMHAYTHEAANDPEHGIMYNAPAARRSKAAVEMFLRELFEPVTA